MSGRVSWRWFLPGLIKQLGWAGNELGFQAQEAVPIQPKSDQVVGKAPRGLSLESKSEKEGRDVANDSDAKAQSHLTGVSGHRARIVSIRTWTRSTCTWLNMEIKLPV